MKRSLHTVIRSEKVLWSYLPLINLSKRSWTKRRKRTVKKFPLLHVAATLATVATDVDNSIGNTQTGDYYLYTLLKHPALFHERLQLSDFNQLLLQHVEVKEATKADVDSPQRMAPLQASVI